MRVSAFPGEGPRRVVVAREDIATRRQAESERELLAEITRSMNEAWFALEANWRFTVVNDRGVTLLRRSRARMLGRTIWEAFDKLVGTPMEQNRRAMRQRMLMAFEAWPPIAERKRAEAALRHSEELSAADLQARGPAGTAHCGSPTPA